jgi:hypothetical protein
MKLFKSEDFERIYEDGDLNKPFFTMSPHYAGLVAEKSNQIIKDNMKEAYTNKQGMESNIYYFERELDENIHTQRIHYYLEELEPEKEVCDHKIEIEVGSWETVIHTKSYKIFKFCPTCGERLNK